jgi:hypothetical protein
MENWLPEWIVYDPNARRLCGLESHEQVAGFIYIGHSTEVPTVRHNVAEKVKRRRSLMQSVVR